MVEEIKTFGEEDVRDGLDLYYLAVMMIIFRWYIKNQEYSNIPIRMIQYMILRETRDFRPKI